MVKRSAWLSITPEPERELPEAVATLAHGRRPTAVEVAREQAKIERLVLRGGQRRWLRYLHEVARLIERVAGDENPQIARARVTATAVLSNHHNLLLALPGPGARLTEADRRRLASDTNTHDREDRDR